ncbi:MAG: M48 family metallopeptidase [Methanobacteriota archaeon]
MVAHVRVGPDSEYRAEFRKVKSPSVEFDSGQMTLVLPKRARPEDSVQEFAAWIGSVHAGIVRALAAARKRELEDRSQTQFRQLVWRFAEEHSKTLGVDFYKIYFKKATEKWASCGSDGNITVNTLMRQLPERLIDYVIFHEVAHRRELSHNKEFWRIVAQRYPERHRFDVELFVYWLMVNKMA